MQFIEIDQKSLLKNPDLIDSLPQEILSLDERRRNFYRSLSEVYTRAVDKIIISGEHVPVRDPVFASTIQSSDLPKKIREILSLAGVDFERENQIDLNSYCNPSTEGISFDISLKADEDRDPDKVARIAIYPQTETPNAHNRVFEWDAFDGKFEGKGVLIRAWTPDYNPTQTEVETTDRVGLLHRVLSDRRHEDYQIEFFQEVIDLLKPSD